MTEQWELAASQRLLSASHWLLSAHPKPNQAREEWSKAGGLVLLPLGTVFSAVRIPERLVHAAAGSEDPTAVNAFLADALFEGPVICDPRASRFYALVPPSSDMEWPYPGAEHLGHGTYLGVPRLDAVDPNHHAWSSYWSVPMSSADRLCGEAAVAHLVAAGSLLTAETETV